MTTQERLDTGRQLLARRAKFPARGTRAGGWTAHLRSIGIPRSTAARCMQIASDYDYRGGQRTKASTERHANEAIAGVYFVRAKTGGPIKIGKSSDIAARLAALQTGSPVELELVGVARVEDATKRHELERALHRRLRGHRLHGEWFIDCERVRRAMAEVCQ